MSLDKAEKSTGTRHKARECALQMLFASDLVRDDDCPTLTRNYWNELGDQSIDDKTREFANSLACGTLKEIASIDGVDVLFVGPRDLSHDLGVPGQVTAPEYLDAIEQVRNASRNHGKACGLLVSDGDKAAEKVSEGWSFVTVGSDSTLLAGAVTAQLARARRQQSPAS